MRRLVPVLLAVLLGVVALAAVALRRAGEDRHEGLREEALALARVLRGAAEEATAALATAEDHLARRLAAAARRADAELSGDARALPADVLDRIAREEGVGRAFLLDAGGAVVAAARHPADLPAAGDPLVPRERLQDVERSEAEAAARALAPAAGEVRREGLRPNAFGARERFGLAYGRAEGGTILLRAEADELAAMRRRFGLGPLLARTAEQPGVRRVSVLDGRGEVLLDGAGREPGTAVGIPAEAVAGGECARAESAGVRAIAALPAAEGGPFYVDVLLSTERADAAAGRTRTVVLLAAAATALATGALVGREARRRRAEAREAARRAEERRLVEMGALAGLVTHEVANPLNAVRLGLRVLRDAPADAPRGPLLAPLEEEVARMSRTLEGFLGLARGEGRAREPVGPAILERVRDRVGTQAAARRVRVRLAVDDGAPEARGDPVVLEEALLNLARNAVAAAPEGSEVVLAWGPAEGGGAVVTVRDRGPGFPPAGREDLLRLGAAAGASGHGLGLPLAQRFVRLQGGRLELGDAPGGGALVTVRLPAREGDARG